jgi:hypothetical protein
MKMKKIMICATMAISTSGLAQDSTNEKSNPLSFSGFVEAYYSYDFNKPIDINRPFFFYSHNRHNEFNINLAYLKGGYTSDMTRANIALGIGTYMNANYSAEPGVLKNIYEADAGVKISKNKNLWIDIGVLPSHIGFESAHSPECWILTRSIIADNSPYLEGGAKITYTTSNNKWLMSALALNGWQRIQRIPGNSLMSWGTQLQFKPSTKLTLNYSTFLGTDKPDSTRQFRHFHNIYGIIQITDKIALILDLDIGQEQKAKGTKEYNTWYGTATILRFMPNTDWAFAVRGEYYDDEEGVIISTGTVNGFKTFGTSFNIDRTIGDHFLWRTEIRWLNSKDKIFIKDKSSKKTNTAITTSFALTF